MAVYKYVDEEDDPIENIESALNLVLFNGIELFDNGTGSRAHLYPYLASQIYRDNLTYRFVMECVSSDPNAREEIDLYKLSYSNRKRVPTKEINMLILSNPVFLSQRNVPMTINLNFMDILYRYLKVQINLKAINEEELLKLYPYMWKYLLGEIE